MQMMLLMLMMLMLMMLMMMGKKEEKEEKKEKDMLRERSNNPNLKGENNTDSPPCKCAPKMTQVRLHSNAFLLHCISRGNENGT